MKIGKQMEAVRLERGLSLERVSDQVNAARWKDEFGKPLTLNAAALSRIERGEGFPALRTMLALARVYGVHFIVTEDGVEIAEPA